MWKNATPTLPGYVFYGFNRAGRCPKHEIGCVQLSDNIVVLWALRMYSAEGRSKLVGELNPALSAYGPSAALTALNDALCQAHPDASQCAELGVMLFNRSDHTLTVTAAGDFLPVLRTPDNQIVTLDRSKTGVPLGAIPSMEYPKQIVELAPTTSVVSISPYTTQIRSSSENLYGLDRLRDQFKAAPAGPKVMLEWIANDIEDFIGDYDQTEDICMMCCQRID